MTVGSKKCVRLLSQNSSLINFFAVFVLALLNLPKKQLSEISFKINLYDRNILNLRCYDSC